MLKEEDFERNVNGATSPNLGTDMRFDASATREGLAITAAFNSTFQGHHIFKICRVTDLTLPLLVCR